MEDQHTGIDQSPAAATQVHLGGGTHVEHSLGAGPAPPTRRLDAAPNGSLQRPKVPPTLRGPSDQLGSRRWVAARAAAAAEAVCRWRRQRWKLQPATAARQSTLSAVQEPMST